MFEDEPRRGEMIIANVIFSFQFRRHDMIKAINVLTKMNQEGVKLLKMKYDSNKSYDYIYNKITLKILTNHVRNLYTDIYPCCLRS